MSIPAGKRAFDVAVSGAALVALSPVMAACAVAIRATMGSPVLFRQARGGYRGSTFEIVKFRTMTHATSGVPDFGADGARLTRLGSFLRNTSLDELPQLWNVLRGDMSLVGPRPLVAEYLGRYTPEQARRHDVAPGLTGWAQVRGRNAITWEAKFALDLWYVEHRSFMLDLRILCLTAVRLLRPQGIASGSHPTMPEFLGTRAITNGAGGNVLAPV